MADTNWQIVQVGHSDTRIMLDLRDPSASYFNIHYMDMAGDETYVEYVHNIEIFGGEERVEIDRCALDKGCRQDGRIHAAKASREISKL